MYRKTVYKHINSEVLSSRTWTS